MYYLFKYIVIISILSLSPFVTAAVSCKLLLSDQKRSEIRVGAKFIHSHNPDFHTNRSVQTRAIRSGLTVSSNPVDKLESWLIAMEQAKSRSSTWRRLKNQLLDKLIIDEVPQSYFSNLIKTNRERGLGDIKYNSEQKREITQKIQHDQRESLSLWIDYFFSEDTNIYPSWMKLWSFSQMTKLGALNRELSKFSKRNQSSTAPFVGLNREALAYVLDGVLRAANGEDLSGHQDQLFIELLERKNFGKLYAHAILKLTAADTVNINIDITSGEWIKYERGSDHRHLVDSLCGKNTGWCTAGESFAKSHLESGDFYVYYLNNKDGLPTHPRIAIRMEAEQIKEIRGVGPDQNLDSEIAQSGVLKDKLKEFGGQEELYFKQVEHMRKLTVIENKSDSKKEFTKDEIRFLYEIDEEIQGFGYSKDPRISQIIESRNKKEDLAYLFNIDSSRISLTKKEALRGNILYHYGNLELSDHLHLKDESLVLLRKVARYLNLGNLTSANGLVLPKQVGGWLDLRSLTSADGLILPEKVDGGLDLRSLTSAEGLVLPKQVDGGLDLRSLTSAEGLVLPEQVSWGVNLSSLTSAEGLVLPKKVGWELNLSSLTSAEGLVLPEKFAGWLDLRSLTSAEGLVLPKQVDDIGLGSLTSAEGLVLPKQVGGYIDLRSLTSAEGLVLPEKVGRELDLRSLTSAEGLVLPEKIGEWLDLKSLTSAEGLVLPERVGEWLDLRSLTSTEGLVLPKKVGGELDLSSLTSAEGLVLPEKVDGGVDLSSLTSAEGLVFPEKVGGWLNLSSLTSAEGLVLPKQVDGGLGLRSLTSAEGLVLPEKVGGKIYLGSEPVK